MPSKQVPTVLSFDNGVITPEDDMIIGMVFDWPHASTPAKCLRCDGSAVSRVTYAALFAVIGTDWGAGDGSTTFNLPPLSGRLRLGEGGGHAVTDTGGAETHTLTLAEIPAHAHGVNDAGHHHSIPVLTSSISLTAGNTCAQGVSDANTDAFDSADNGTGISIQNNGGGGAHSVLNPFACFRPLIYAGV